MPDELVTSLIGAIICGIIGVIVGVTIGLGQDPHTAMSVAKTALIDGGIGAFIGLILPHIPWWAFLFIDFS